MMYSPSSRVTRGSSTRDDVFPFQPGHARVFNAELFIGGKWAVRRRSEKGLWIGGEFEFVAAAGPNQDGPAGNQNRTEKHDRILVVVYNRCRGDGVHLVRGHH